MNTSNRSLGHLSKLILLLLLFENTSYGGAVKRFFGFGKKQEPAPVSANDLSQPQDVKPAPAQPSKQSSSALPAQSKPNSRSSSRTSSVGENETPNEKDRNKKDKGKKEKGKSSKSSRSSSTEEKTVPPRESPRSALELPKGRAKTNDKRDSKANKLSAEDNRKNKYLTVMFEVSQLLSPDGLDFGFVRNQAGEYRQIHAAELEGKEKKSVAQETYRGFALNSRFERWQDIYEKNENQILSSRDDEHFAENVNTLFQKNFEASHLVLSSPEKPAKPESTKEKLRNPSPQRRRESVPNVQPQNSTGPTLSFVDNGRVAVLKVPDFDETYSPFCMERLVQHAINSKTKSMVVDFQGNLGGRVKNLNHFKMMFHPNNIGTVGITADDVDQSQLSNDPPELRLQLRALYQKKAERELAAVKANLTYMPPYYDKPLAVLVDQYSASCAEDAATCLKTVRGARAYGTPSTGKLLHSIEAKLSYDFKFQVPIGDVITHEGKRVEGKGVSVESGEPPRVILDCLELSKISDVLSEKSEVCSDGEPVDFSNKQRVRRYTCDDILKIDAKVADTEGRISLHYAAMNKDSQILGKTIQSHKTNDYIDFQDSVDKTPLHYAVQNNLVNNAELLLISGAKMNIKDKNGRTAYDYVLDTKPPNEDMVKLFVKYQDKGKSKSGLKKPTKRR